MRRRASAWPPSSPRGEPGGRCVAVTDILAFLVRHGEVVLFLYVFADQLGVPLPAVPILFAARQRTRRAGGQGLRGGACRRHRCIRGLQVDPAPALAAQSEDRASVGGGASKPGSTASLDVKAVPYAIPGAVRVAAEDLEQRHPDLARDREIVLYCSRPNEATSARVALLLRRKGITRIRPLAAGLEGWRQRGFPLEPGGIGSIGPLQASQIGSASAFARARSSAPRRSSTRSRATASMSRYSCASSQPMVFGCLS